MACWSVAPLFAGVHEQHDGLLRGAVGSPVLELVEDVLRERLAAGRAATGKVRWKGGPLAEAVQVGGVTAVGADPRPS